MKGVIRILGKELPLVENSKPTIQISCEPNSKLGPLSRSWVRTIGVVCGNLLHSCSSAGVCVRKMSRRHLESYAESGSRGSLRGSSWRERRPKRDEDHRYEQEKDHSSLGEESFRTYRLMSGTSGYEHFEKRDEELERLHKLVRDLELEARCRRQKRDREERVERSASLGGSHGQVPYQSCSHRHQDRSLEYVDRDSISPEGRQPQIAAMDAMSRALHRTARSPFSGDIERAPMSSRFTRPPFNFYDGKTDPVEHVSHYVQMMYLHSHNDTLMCKVFRSSLGPTALRWFNGLRKGSIHSFAELIQEFRVRFMTCSRVPQLVDTLLSMKMGAKETLRSYTSQY